MRTRKPWSASRLHVDGTRLTDVNGSTVLLHGINLIHKGKRRTDGTFNFYPNWPDDLYRRFADMGLTVVRLGILWAALEPQPGQYNEDYFTFIRRQLDLANQAGQAVVLDMHQDLYAQRFSDGAPDWAVLTEHPFEETALWSDAYLFSPAVQESWDHFWQNAPVPATGKGLQDHFAALWGEISRRFHDHPALLGYDILNEPAPGSDIQAIFGAVLQGFAQLMTKEEAAALGLESPDMDAMAAVFMDPEKKLLALDMLNDPERYRQLGEKCKAPVARFEQQQLGPFYQRVAAAIRRHDTRGFILRGNNYMSNIGIPSGIEPIMGPDGPDPRQIFAPHGYDLTVDTPAIDHASDSRAGSIFARHRETQQRLNIPVLVGEWGAFGASPAAVSHGRFLVELFEQYGWSSTYWCYESALFDTPAFLLLRRPRPLVVAGEIQTHHYDAKAGRFTLSWQEEAPAQGAMTELFLHQVPVSAELDGQPLDAERLLPGRMFIKWAGGLRQLSLSLPPHGAGRG